MLKSIFDLDMTPNRTLPLIVNVSQYDDIGRTLVFNLFSFSGKWTAPTSASVTFEGGKPDGKFFAYNCAYSSGTVTVTIQQQMTAVAGKVRCKIKVTSGSKVVESAPIIMVVDAAAVPDGSDMSKTDINDAIANATQKIVDQVKDNIPDDYAQLSTDVNNLNQGGLNLKEEFIGKQVNGWLDMHPEATTTVQDGAIAEEKINATFLPWIKKDYITPEMFGAVGDGVTDDTIAIKKTITFAKENGKSIYGIGTYYIIDTIIFDGFNYLSVTFYNIIYVGIKNAILITNSSLSEFNFFYIRANNGSCIKYFSDSNKGNRVSYTSLKFRMLNAKEKCIYLEIGENDGYVNENLIYGGWLNQGEYGIYADAKGRQEIQFKAYNIGFEGVNNCVYLNGTSSCIFTNCRYAENINAPLIISNGAKYIFWIGCNKFYSKRLKLSLDTTGKVIAPIAEDGGGIVAYDGTFENGLIIPKIILTNKYLNAIDSATDLTSFTNYLTTCCTFFLVSATTKIIKLNKLYGSIHGINQFICKFIFDSGTEFTIYDSEGNLIFNNTADAGWSIFRFTWQNEVGWLCEKINYISPITG